MRLLTFGLRTARRMCRDSQGLAAVEFAFLAIPFVLLFFAIVEVSLSLIMSLALATATSSMSRQIRVGGLLAPGAAATTTSGAKMSLSDFKIAICSRIYLIGNNTCLNNLQVDVRTLSNFTTAPASPISGRNFSTSGFCFYSGGPGDAVEVRAYYLWPLINPMLWSTMANITSSTTNAGTTTGNWMAVSSTDIFVNEPNTAVANTGVGC